MCHRHTATLDCIIFRVHIGWQLTFRWTIYVIVWFNASLTQSLMSLSRGLHKVFSVCCLFNSFPQLIYWIYVAPRLCLLIENIFPLDLIKYQHSIRLYKTFSLVSQLVLHTHFNIHQTNHYELILWHLHCGKTCVTNVINFV